MRKNISKKWRKSQHFAPSWIRLKILAPKLPENVKLDRNNRLIAAKRQVSFFGSLWYICWELGYTKVMFPNSYSSLMNTVRLC